MLIVLFSCTTEVRTISSISVSEVSKSACKGNSYAKTTRSAVGSEGKTSLIIGTLSNCYCDYDVNFNLDNIEENNYPIKIYVTNGLQKLDTGRLVYEGNVTFSKKTDFIPHIDIPKITL